MLMSPTITKIAAAILDAQKNMGNATKESKNPFFKSSYADLNSIRDVVTPALNAVGISVMQPTMMASDGSSYVETTLMHSSGEYFMSQFPIVAAKANDPQAFGSAVSYARRYALQSFLSVGAVDDDGEASMGRKTTSAAPVVKAETPSTVTVAATPAPKKVTFAKKSISTGDEI